MPLLIELAELAWASAVLLIRCPLDADEAASSTAFERGVDDVKALRRQGSVAVQRTATAVELRVAVHYGPVQGCWASDIRRPLERIVMWIPGSSNTYEVTAFKRHHLKTLDDLAKVITTLTAELDSGSLSSAAQQYVHSILARLREQFPSVKT